MQGDAAVQPYQKPRPIRGPRTWLESQKARIGKIPREEWREVKVEDARCALYDRGEVREWSRARLPHCGLATPTTRSPRRDAIGRRADAGEVLPLPSIVIVSSGERRAAGHGDRADGGDGTLSQLREPALWTILTGCTHAGQNTYAKVPTKFPIRETGILAVNEWVPARVRLWFRA